LNTPYGWSLGSGYYEDKFCVNTACISKNVGYYGYKVHEDKTKIHTPEGCQQICQPFADKGAIAFTLKNDNTKCKCLAKDGTEGKELKLMVEEGSFSGPLTCDKKTSVEVLEEQIDDTQQENARVPMEEVAPCDKSEGVSNFEDLEQKNPEWIKTCYKKSTQVLTKEYNKFYLRFGKFVDSLTWKAGCGSQHKIEWVRNDRADNYLEVSEQNDAGLFSECNWRMEEKKDKDQYIFDEVRARGILGNSKVNLDEQKKIKMMYPMPAWLHDLRDTEECLLKSIAGSQVENPDSGRSSAVGTIMEPTSGDSWDKENF